MRRGLGEFEDEGPQLEREITLGTGMLMAVGGCILALCGLSFWLGISVGRQGSTLAARAQTQAASPQVDAGQGAAAISSSKPLAAGSGSSAAQMRAQPAASQLAEANAASTIQALPASAPAQATSSSLAQPQVKPALPVDTAPSAAPSTASSAVQPAPAMGAGLMVQIASLSHVEDARVLMNALRQRGYSAFARRESSDGMIHVQIGPFASRSEADTMSRKLEGDGYNAEVQLQ